MLTTDLTGIISGMALYAGRVSAHACTEPPHSCHSHGWPHTDTGTGLAQSSRGTASSSWASVSEAEAKAEIITPPANSLLPNFMKLKNTCEHLCVVISKMVPSQQTEVRQAGCDTPSTQPTCRDLILSMQSLHQKAHF